MGKNFNETDVTQIHGIFEVFIRQVESQKHVDRPHRLDNQFLVLPRPTNHMASLSLHSQNLLFSDNIRFRSLSAMECK